MMGPLFIHQCKKYVSYHFFASSLVGLRPALSDLKMFGTDGEKALSNAFQMAKKRCQMHSRWCSRRQSIYVVFFTSKAIWETG